MPYFPVGKTKDKGTKPCKLSNPCHNILYMQLSLCPACEGHNSLKTILNNIFHASVKFTSVTKVMFSTAFKRKDERILK